MFLFIKKIKNNLIFSIHFYILQEHDESPNLIILNIIIFESIKNKIILFLLL